MNGSAALTVHFSPLADHQALVGVMMIGAAMLLLSLMAYRRALIGRTLCLVCFLLLFLNPSLVEEQRDAVPDIAVVVTDRSPSQQTGERMARTEKALAAIKNKLAGNPRVELRVVDAPAAGTKLTRETRLFEAADQAFADVPLARRAGVILLTDGQVHDVPADPARLKEYGPVHAVLTGEHHERDRRLTIVEAPAYGIVGQQVNIKFKVEDTSGSDGAATVIIRSNGKESYKALPLNTEQDITVTIDHAGQNVFDLEAEPLDGEISAVNNRAPVIVNGVRDRLRVLLVSGQPHNGGRTWRDMLTSDPGVDLVHFTILREPEKLDMTPQNELSLIAFPFRELFEVKLYDFDLIIFDRYRLNRILPSLYFDNIVRYVKEGGALLEASGPSFTTDESIYNTDIRDILPAAPTGEILEQPYRPTLTDTGKRHPVTQNLHWSGQDSDHPEWGRWLRQVGVTPKSGEVLMNGVDDRPLLILDHVEKGRVAQLASDQIWLWSRGYDGGGPNTELLRRLAHWLMKEPELEEDALNATIENGDLVITRRTLDNKPVNVRVTAPDGKQQKIDLKPTGDGMLQAILPADQFGIYTVKEDDRERFAVNGELNPPELRGLVTTPDILAPAVRETYGTTLWLADTPSPDIRLLPGGRSYGGRNWLGLRTSDSFNVTGVIERPLLPMWAWAAFLLGLLIAAWWMEGRKKRPLVKAPP